MIDVPAPEPSVIYGHDSQAYRDAPGLSHSDSRRLRVTPWHFHALTLPGRPPPRAPSPQMFAGTLMHCALLEGPDVFNERYPIGPEVSKNSNRWKDFVAECTARGATPITEAEAERAFAQALALSRDPVVSALLRQDAVRTEVSCWWTCPRTGILCKARPDLVAPVGLDGHEVMLLDAKSTADADEWAFARSVADYGYHTQADWYCEGYGIAAGAVVKGMVFGVVEAEYPYAARAFVMSDNALERARAENDNARHLFRSCNESGQWPGYPHDSTGITQIDLPKWY